MNPTGQLHKRTTTLHSTSFSSLPTLKHTQAHAHTDTHLGSERVKYSLILQSAVFTIPVFNQTSVYSSVQRGRRSGRVGPYSGAVPSAMAQRCAAWTVFLALTQRRQWSSCQWDCECRKQCQWQTVGTEKQSGRHPETLLRRQI